MILEKKLKLLLEKILISKLLNRILMLLLIFMLNGALKANNVQITYYYFLFIILVKQFMKKLLKY